MAHLHHSMPPPPTWFKRVFGFEERVLAYDKVAAKFSLGSDGGGSIVLESKENMRRFAVGPFSTPRHWELHAQLAAAPAAASFLGGLIYSSISGDAGAMHRDESNDGAVFMVASQFNCLEMVSPLVSHLDGITKYENDCTQGPACALACPGATVYRNYFLPQPFDTLSDVAATVGNEHNRYWAMQNGYAMPDREGGIAELGARLGCDPGLRLAARDSLRVGVHWSTEVECPSHHRVTQVFCSALPVAYSSVEASAWEPLARTILEATFSATLSVGALLARQRRARVRVYLTAVGGGAFGNEPQWIADAIAAALRLHSQEPLDVALVFYGAVPAGGPLVLPGPTAAAAAGFGAPPA